MGGTRVLAVLDAASYRSTISTSGHHSLVIKADGTVWACGSNSDGQLGVDPSLLPLSDSPLLVPGLTNIVSVAAGDGHSLALASDGTVYTWGRNVESQLARTTTTPWTPGIASAVAGAKGIAAGRGISFAIRSSDGAVWAWGTFPWGTYPIPPSFQIIPSLTNAVKIAPCDTTGEHAVLTASGTIYTLQGISANSGPPPNLVAPVTNAIDVAANASSGTGDPCVAVLADGSAILASAYWSTTYALPGSAGMNLTRVTRYGIKDPANTPDAFFLGSNGAIYQMNPERARSGYSEQLELMLPTPTGVTELAGGSAYPNTLLNRFALLFRKSDGTVVGRGTNLWGDLGNGSHTSRTSPIRVSLPTSVPVKKVVSRESFSAALLTNGEVYIWGPTDLQSSLVKDHLTPIPTKLEFSTSVTVADIAQGRDFLVMSTSNGQVYVWGQAVAPAGMGKGNNDPQWIPSAINGITTASKVFSTDSSIYCLLTTGTVKSWGSNSEGVLGSGNMTTDRSTPGDVKISSTTALSSVIDVAPAYAHTFYLTSAGKLRATGLKNYILPTGGTGNFLYANTNIQDSTGSDISGVSGVTAYGPYINFARLTTGSIIRWGSGPNEFGQLGTGSTIGGAPTLITIPAVSSTSATNIGISPTTAFIYDGGTLRAWGDNRWGQLGDGSTINSYTPPTVGGPITGLSYVTGSGVRGAGEYPTTMFGVKSSDGSLWAWGNTYPQTSGVWRPNFSQMAINLSNSPQDDEDYDGLLDSWEKQYFVNIQATDGGADSDGDGITNIQEQALGTNPNSSDSDGDGVPDTADTVPADAYNGLTPTLTKQSGDNQFGMTGSALPNNLTVVVKKPDNSNFPLVPVVFTITSGTAELKTTDGLVSGQSITARTDSVGIAQISCKLLGADADIVTVSASANGTQQTFTARTSDIPVSSLRMRLRADRNTTPFSGPLTSWTDSNGFAISAVPPGSASGPNLVANALNGRPIAHFQGGSRLKLNGTFSNSLASHIFAVARPTNTTDGDLISFYYNSGILISSYLRLGFASTAGENLLTLRSQIGDKVLTAEKAVGNGYNLYEFSVDPAGTASIYRNGTLLGTLSNATRSMGSMTGSLGCGPNDGSPYLNGDLAEIVVYDRCLTSAERNLVLTSLNTRWISGQGSLFIFAGPDQDVVIPEPGVLSTYLSGAPVAGFGAPTPQVVWELKEGPTLSNGSAATAMFADESDPHTLVSVSEPGTYIFRLHSVSDPTNFDEVAIWFGRFSRDTMIFLVVDSSSSMTSIRPTLVSALNGVKSRLTTRVYGTAANANSHISIVDISDERWLEWHGLNYPSPPSPKPSSCIVLSFIDETTIGSGMDPNGYQPDGDGPRLSYIEDRASTLDYISSTSFYRGKVYGIHNGGASPNANFFIHLDNAFQGTGGYGPYPLPQTKLFKSTILDIADSATVFENDILDFLGYH